MVANTDEDIDSLGAIVQNVVDDEESYKELPELIEPITPCSTLTPKCYVYYISGDKVKVLCCSAH